MKYKSFKGYFFIAYDENGQAAALLESYAEVMRFFDTTSAASMNSKLSRYFSGQRKHIRAGSHKYTLAKIEE